MQSVLSIGIIRQENGRAEDRIIVFDFNSEKYQEVIIKGVELGDRSSSLLLRKNRLKLAILIAKREVCL
jgi:hypothetical protein